MFCSSSQPRWDFTIHLLWNPVFSLTHRLVSTFFRSSASLLAYCPVFGSDTICNSSSLPIIDIILFELFGISLKVFKTRLLWRVFHTLIKNVSFFFSTDMWSYNPPPLEPSVFVDTPPSVHLLSGSAYSLANCLVFDFDTICNSSSLPIIDIILFGLFGISLKVFKTRLLGRVFHTLIKNASFFFSTDVGFYNPPPLKPSVLADTPPSVHLLSGSTYSLANCLVSDLDTICNSSSLPIIDIILFGLFGISLKVFKTRLLGRVFHTLIKNASFFFSTDVGSYNPPPLGSSVLADTPPSVHLLSGFSLLASKLSHVCL